MYFRNYAPRNMWLNKCLKISFQRTVRQATWSGVQKLLEFEPHHLYHNYWSLCRILSWKKDLLAICKFLVMFVNILTVHDKYSLLNWDNFREPVQMQLSQKQKPFSEFVCAFLKFILKVEHFRNKYDRHSWSISKITDSEKRD